jgi:replicative DNA helicase
VNITDLDLIILKVLTSNKRYALEFVYELNEKVFEPDVWRFAKIVIDYIKVYKEVPTKRVILEKINNEKLVEYVNELFVKLDSVIYDDREYKHDLEKLKNRYIERSIIGLKESLVSESGFDVKKNIAEIKATLQSVNNISGNKIYKDGSLKEYAEEFKTLYNAKENDISFDAGFKTNYTFIDYAIGGLKAGELLLFAGITSAGKSLLLSNTAIQLWLGDNDISMTKDFKKSPSILLFSLEMNYFEYMQRILARLAMVPERSIRNATLTNEEKMRVSNVFKFIKNYPFQFKVIDLPRKATAQMVESIIEEQENKGLKADIVVIDYLNLMHAETKEQSDWLVQSKISEEIHELCRTKEIAILSAIQLNPKGSGGDGKDVGGIKSFRRATAIADNANFIIGINSRKEEKNYPDLSCSFLKNRRGELLDGKLYKKLDCCALLDKKIDINTDPEDISNEMERLK